MIETTPETGFRSLGQPAARRIVQRAAARNRLARTILLHGPAGAGKDAFVDDLLALAFCTDADLAIRPCNVCRGCRDARARTHPDLVTGSPEGWREQRSSGESIVAAARRWLLEAAGAPVVAERRVILIEHLDRAGEQIQNALLKALEEPTDRHAFILVADEPARVLPTIRSRSQPVRIGPVPREELAAFLVDHRGLPADLADALARISGGLTGRALEYVARKDLLTWRTRTQTELLSLLERGRADRFGAVRDLIDDAVPFVGSSVATDAEPEGARTPASVQREAAVLVVEVWLALSRDLLVAAAGRPQHAPGTELGPELAAQAGRIGLEPMRRMIDLLERIHAGLRENAAPRLALETAMLAWPMLRSRTER